MAAPIILFEDTHLIVLDKPAGLLSQGEHTGDENLVDWLRQYLGRPYVGMVHRLDRNTSGIMIVGKRTKSAQRLTESLQGGKMVRSYLAWLEGRMPPEPQRWRHFLLKDEKRNVVKVVTEASERASRGGGDTNRGGSAKEAVLAVKAIRSGRWHGSEVTLAEFVLETGRSHQIRVQASFEGHPLLGDLKYGARLKPDFGRPALHSHRLRFEHPMSHEWMEFEAKLPKDMASIQN